MHTREDEPAPGPTFKSARGDRDKYSYTYLVNIYNYIYIDIYI